MERDPDEVAHRYLARIGLNEPPSVDLDGLETLQRAHLTSVPFENLDVFARRGVDTSLTWSIPKIVDRRRGGWCFELNGAFASLLTFLGFTVTLHGAAVLLPERPSGLSHLTLVVSLGGQYLVDVGFGDSFIKPLLLSQTATQDGGWGEYRLSDDGQDTTLFDVKGHRDPEPLYRFSRASSQLSDFIPVSDRLQTTPGLRWTESRFATRLIDGGPDRVTLLEDRIRLRRGGVWTEEPVSPESWSHELGRWFGLAP